MKFGLEASFVSPAEVQKLADCETENAPLTGQVPKGTNRSTDENVVAKFLNVRFHPTSLATAPTSSRLETGEKAADLPWRSF